MTTTTPLTRSRVHILSMYICPIVSPTFRNQSRGTHTFAPFYRSISNTLTMSGLMDKAKNALGNKADKDAQPGNSVERKADDFANNGKHDFQLRSFGWIRNRCGEDDVANI